MQNINGVIKPEIGYHIRKDMRKKGYAKEVASAARDWTFYNTPFNEIYSYMNHTNEPSIKTTISFACRLSDEYEDKFNEKLKFLSFREKFGRN